MTNRPTLTVRRLLLAVCTAALALGYVLVAPTSLGGPATWARTAGSSMQPGIEQGDLVIARPQPTYRVGDVIAYRSNHLGGTMIVHRIIGMENGAFLTKGDNNNWVDPDQPTPADVLGEVSLHIPKGGHVLAAFTDPQWLTLAGLITTAGITGATLLGRARRRTHGNRGNRGNRAGGASRASRASQLVLDDGDHSQGGTDAPTAWPAAAPAAAAVKTDPARAAVGKTAAARSDDGSFPRVGEYAAAAAAAALALGVLGFTQPTHRAGSDTTPARHTAELSYSAAVDGDAVYTDGQVNTGDPVFTSLVPVLNTELHYELTELPAPPSRLEGTVQSVARLSAGNGWSQTFPLGPARTFTGPTVDHQAELNFNNLRRRAGAAEKAAGTTFGGLTVTVIHQIQLRGSVTDQPVDSTYRPELSFTLDAVQALPGPTSVPAGEDTVVRHDDPAPVITTATTTEPVTVTVLRWAIPVTALRILAGLAAAAAAVLTLAALTRTHRTRPNRNTPAVPTPGSAPASAPTSLRERSIAADVIDLGDRPVIEVRDPAALVQLATHYDLPIAHLSGPGSDFYVTIHNQTAYRYTQPHHSDPPSRPAGAPRPRSGTA